MTKLMLYKRITRRVLSKIELFLKNLTKKKRAIVLMSKVASVLNYGSVSSSSEIGANINPWFTGLWFALLFTGGGWITRHPLLGAGRVMDDFFQFIPYCMCQMQVHANFWVPELKNTGFGAVLLFWQNHMSKILRFWIERIKTALNFLKMYQICWERS